MDPIVTPQKPPSDSESLQNFIVWKFFSINSEVTSEVFPDFLRMVKFVSGWYSKFHHAPSFFQKLPK